MKSYYLFLLLLVICSCRKDSENTYEYDPPHDPDIEIVDDFTPVEDLVTASVLGKVLNENGYPIADALVTLGEETTETNEKGIFLFKSVEMNAEGTFVKAQKDPTYFVGASRFFPNEDSENYVTIRLVPKLEHSRFRATEGTIISTTSGTQLSIESNSLLRSDGELYTDEVSVYAHYLAPDEKHFLEFMPGNLQGIDRKSQEVALMSYGLLAIELRSETGDILKLDKEKPARLSYAIIEAQSAVASAEVPFWSFNMLYGLWQDGGDAFLSDDKYVAEVTDLSFVHIAEAAPMINFQGRLQTDEGLPIPNLLVQTNDYTSLEGAYAYTDNDGFFSTNIPAEKNTDVWLSANKVDCIDWPLESVEYTADENIGNIILTESPSIQIAALEGTLVNCTDEAINEFFIDVNAGDNSYCYYQLDGNEVDLALPHCTTSNALSVSVQDLINFHESGVLAYGADIGLDLGLLELCGDGIADYIIIKFPGTDAILFDEPELVIGDTTHLIGYEDSLNQIDLSFIGETAGTYTDDQIDLFRGAFPSNAATIGINCNTGCGFDQLIVEEYGSIPGEKIKGKFSGGGAFSIVGGSTGTGNVQIPFEGTFSITIKQ